MCTPFSSNVESRGILDMCEEALAVRLKLGLPIKTIEPFNSVTEVRYHRCRHHSGSPIVTINDDP
jgi:hypothetical protein